MNNVERARRGYAAVARGDFDAVAEFLDPDVKWHGGNPDEEGACHNRGEALAFMRAAAGRGPLGELVDVIEAGSDRVVVVMRRRSQGGEPGELGASVTTFRDGRAIEMVAYGRPEDAFAAVGLERPRPAAG